MSDAPDVPDLESRFLDRLGLGGRGVPILRPEEVSADLALPPRLQATIRSRIRLVALLALLGYALSLALVIFGAASGAAPSLVTLRLVTLSATVVLLVGVLLALPRLSAGRSVIVALVIQGLACLFISVPAAVSLTSGGILPPVSWITPIIIMFPLLIPAPPRWTLAASIVCALTAPVGVAAAQLLEFRTFDDPLRAAAYALLAPAVGALIAYFGSSTVYAVGLGAERGRRAGSYLITRKLGEGGMGEVYVAHHQRLPRAAAIKFIRPEQLEARYGTREKAFRRFEREAAALVRLRSPHTVDVFDYDLDDRGRLFYAMELLDGWNASELVEEFGALPPRRVVHLVSQACLSLGEAHRLGIVHRDIKPSNLMICRYGLESDFVKVMDFGILTVPAGEPPETGAPGPPDGGRIAPVTEGPAPTLTGGDRVMGTVDFMSPEQVLRERLDGRSDIYSLALVAYYMATGTFAFRGGDPASKMRRQVDEAPEPLSTRNASVPRALEQVILGAAAKRREERPASAEQFAELLLAAVPERWSVEERELWWEEHRPQEKRADNA